MDKLQSTQQFKKFFHSLLSRSSDVPLYLQVTLRSSFLSSLTGLFSKEHDLTYASAVLEMVAGYALTSEGPVHVVTLCDF